jgi:glyoxylase-like metal-dependent hydrolase (beta-lactamase superfamily II)
MTWRSIGYIFARAIPLALTWPALAAPAGGTHPGCEGIDAKQCLALAIDAMGGRAALAGITTEKLDIADHTLLTEQSYRQAPFITAYDRLRRSVDFAKSRISTESDSLWPESDPDTASASSSSTTVSTPSAAIMRAESGDTRASRASIDEARATLELGPERLLLTAEAASDLHFEPAETLRSTPHAVVAFGWNGAPVKILINRFNHLPDAVESTRSFNDFWFAWGDVAQRVYYDNWKLIGGVVYPTNRVEERNGVAWSSAQVLDASFNPALDDKAFAMDPAAAAASAQSPGWNRPFDDKHPVQLAPGIDLYQGSWNVTLIKQDDGVVVLETPISPKFTEGVLAKARADNPGRPIKAVLTTSDSWPHAAGVRQAVAEKLPVYLLDLNRPLLERMIAAPHRLQPDPLQTTPQQADWRVVAGKTEIGTGANRLVLYPLRGAATERQYMVYFPEHRLLYASDTLVIDPDKHSLYDPELMREVVQAATREGLKVETVYAMHEGPTAWSEATRLVAAAEGKS